MTKTRILWTVILSLLAATAGYAQDDDDRVLKLAEPDFTLISLPTSLRLPEHGSAFRVTHRFTRPLSCDTCPNSVAGDAFGLDSGARIGLEYRFGLAPNAEVVVHRASDKTVALLGQYGLVRQGKGSPLEASALVAVDISDVGRQQVKSQYSPALGVILTRLVGEKAGLYLEPIWVHHTNTFDTSTSDNNTFVLGLGARVRVLDTVYLVGEFAPRVSGYKPGVNHGGFAIEKRAGGHLFQLNFSDSFATTLGQIARGGTQSVSANGSTQTDWYLGFNISRKFF
jgi:Membrane bound beta barrel domain (DUF5777)